MKLMISTDKFFNKKEKVKICHIIELAMKRSESEYLQCEKTLMICFGTLVSRKVAMNE